MSSGYRANRTQDSHKDNFGSIILISYRLSYIDTL